MEDRIRQLETNVVLLEEALDATQAEARLLRSDLDKVIGVLTALIKKLDRDAAKKGSTKTA
jgi:hypothetical protein